jgi:hypothetical protein
MAGYSNSITPAQKVKFFFHHKRIIFLNLITILIPKEKALACGNSAAALKTNRVSDIY